MSLTYLFFAPTQLPLTTDMLSETTVRSFTDLASVQATLSAHLPTLAWHAVLADALASGTVYDGGAQYEFSVNTSVAPQLVVALRSSGRVDSMSFVQRLCDATGWVAFDARPRCFQPHQPPIPA